jgi:hypothetical protein
MNILDMINGGNNAAIQQITSQFGLSPEQSQAALTALLPMVTAGLQREAASKGEDSLAQVLANGRHETYLSQPEALAEPATINEGNAILGHIFGSKDVSRQVAADAAQKSGIDPAILKKMLPIIATLAMAALARQSKSGNTGGGVTPAPNSGLGGILGGLLDRDRDGSVMDDLAGMMAGRGK